MYSSKKFLNFIRAVLIFSLPIVQLGPAFTSPAVAASGGLASSELGEYNSQDQDVWTQDAVDNNLGTTNPLGLNNPSDVLVDPVGHRLYVSDNNNERILVYTLDSTNHIPSVTPSYVIGQTGFYSNATGVTASNFYLAPYSDMAFDPVRGYLFVSDGADNRVLVFNTNNLATGMSASYVLGQINPTTKATPAIGQSTLNSPSGLAFDPSTNMLYIADAGYDRVMVFNTTSLADDMPASYVIGQQNFATDSHGVANDQTTWFPLALSVDNVNHRLFVADDGNCRILTFDISTLSSDPVATSELGEPDLNSSCTNSDNATAINDPEGISYDSDNNRLFVSDQADGRVLVYDMTNPSDTEAPSAELGQPDFNTITSESAMQSTDEGPGGSWYDSATHQLFVSDIYGDRILIYDLLQLNQSSPSSGTVRETYSSSITASNEQGAVSYQLASGSLAPGLSLGSDGSINGTPTTSGTYDFTIQATDNWGVMGNITDSSSYSLQINAAPTPPPAEPSQHSNAQTSSPTPTPAPTPSATPTNAPAAPLNSDSGFTNSTGASQSLAPDQSVTFFASTTATPDTSDISSLSDSSSYQQHTITVNDVGVNSADLTVASVPIHLHIAVGQTIAVDVNHNGHPAISIYLAGVSNGTANLVIKSLLATASATTTPAQAVANSPNAKNKPAIYSTTKILWLTGVLVIAAILFSIWVRKRKTKMAP